MLEALCEREKLPLDLKILLRINDNFDDVRFYEQKLLPSFNDDVDEHSAESGGFNVPEFLNLH